MHQYYFETIDVCTQAKTMMDQKKKEFIQRDLEKNDDTVGESTSLKDSLAALENKDFNHTCHRHWAFALFKKGDMSNATKKIKKAIDLDPNDPDNWITWGLIMRVFGNYVNAMHKFKHALILEPLNRTAQQEIILLNRIMELDS